MIDRSDLEYQVEVVERYFDYLNYLAKEQPFVTNVSRILILRIAQERATKIFYKNCFKEQII